MIELNTQPTPRELRQFAGIWFLAAAAVLGAVLHWRAQSETATLAVWGLGAFVAVVGLALPAAIKPLYIVLLYVSYPLGWVVSYLILIVIYYLILTPIGLLKRMFSSDPLTRNFDQKAQSYWVPRSKSSQAEDYFRQF